jgi:hypothetical protein
MHWRHPRGGGDARPRTFLSRIDYPEQSYEGRSGQGQEGLVTVRKFFGKAGRGLTGAAAILAAIGLTAVPRPAYAGGGWGGGGISPGAAAGIGLGAFALGSVLASPYAFNPYYAPYGYYGYPPAPAYYPPAAYHPYYPPPASAYPPGPGYTPQATYAPPQVGRAGGNIARQLNQQELNYLQSAPVNPPPPPYWRY